MAEIDHALDADQADALTHDLRAWLRSRREPDQIVAAALVYELAALLARHAPDVPAALQLVDEWRIVMRRQIRQFGIGREHP